MVSKKQIKEEAKRLVAEFQSKEMAIKAITEIKRVLIYFPKTDTFGLNWLNYFERVKAELSKPKQQSTTVTTPTE